MNHASFKKQYQNLIKHNNSIVRYILNNSYSTKYIYEIEDDIIVISNVCGIRYKETAPTLESLPTNSCTYEAIYSATKNVWNNWHITGGNTYLESPNQKVIVSKNALYFHYDGQSQNEWITVGAYNWSWKLTDEFLILGDIVALKIVDEA